MEFIGPVPFICECADKTCTEIVRLNMEQYQQVRGNLRLFVCARGHQG